MSVKNKHVARLRARQKKVVAGALERVNQARAVENRLRGEVRYLQAQMVREREEAVPLPMNRIAANLADFMSRDVMRRIEQEKPDLLRAIYLRFAHRPEPIEVTLHVGPRQPMVYRIDDSRIDGAPHVRAHMGDVSAGVVVDRHMREALNEEEARLIAKADAEAKGLAITPRTY